jgi:hypothetical protein
MTIDDGAVFRGEALSGAADAGAEMPMDEERATGTAAPADEETLAPAGPYSDPQDPAQSEDRT